MATKSSSSFCCDITTTILRVSGHFILPYAVVTFLAYIVVFVLEFMVTSNVIEIVMILGSFTCYHRESLSLPSKQFIYSLWFTLMIYEFILEKNANPNYLLVSTALFCAMMMYPSAPSIADASSASRLYDKAKQRIPFCVSCILWGAVYAMTSFIEATQSLIENHCLFIIASIFALIISVLFAIYTQPIMSYVNHATKASWSLIELILCIVSVALGISIGLKHAVTWIAPYYIGHHHFFVLSTQQNIVYMWYFIPDQNVFFITVMMPLLYYFIETHPDPHQSLIIQMVFLSIAYTFARAREVTRNPKLKRILYFYRKQ